MGVFNELQEVVEEMRQRANAVEVEVGPREAEAVLRRADRLEEHIEKVRTRELTPEEAARECSWSAKTVARRISDGTLPAGPSSEKRARTVRRCDLYAVVYRNEDPREPPGEPQVRELEGPDLAGEILTAQEN